MDKFTATKKNADKINDHITEIETRCTIRLIGAEDIFRAIGEIEKNLSDRLYKKDWIGISIECNPNAQSFPRSYNGTPDATIFLLTRTATTWSVSQIRRATCGTQEYSVIGLSDKSDDLAKFATKNF